MKYIDNFNELEKGKYYHCVTYDDEDIVIEYLGTFSGGEPRFSTDLSSGEIRYVLCEEENLREKRKKFE
jgi:hypothetical protein